MSSQVHFRSEMFFDISLGLFLITTSVHASVNDNAVNASCVSKVETVQSVLDKELQCAQEMIDNKVKNVRDTLESEMKLLKFHLERCGTEPCYPENKKCPSGWITLGKDCFFFFKGRKFHITDAMQTCASMNSRLLEIETTEEMKYFRDLAVKEKGNIMLGGMDVLKEGTWVWLSGRPLNQSVTPWGPSEPNGKTGENCLWINPNGNLVDAGCHGSALAVCELI